MSFKAFHCCRPHFSSLWPLTLALSLSLMQTSSHFIAQPENVQAALSSLGYILLNFIQIKIFFGFRFFCFCFFFTEEQVLLVYGAKKGFVCFRVLWLCWHVNGTSPRDKDMTHPFIISGHVFWPQNGSRVAHCNGFLLEGQRRCTTNGRIRSIWKLFSYKKVCLYLCLLDMSRCEAVSLCTCHLHGYRGRTSSYLRNHTWNVVHVCCVFVSVVYEPQRCD